MSRDFVIEQHKEWLGLLQSASSGLVVAPVALKDAQLQIDKNVFELSNKLNRLLDKDGNLPSGNFKKLLSEFFEWPEECLSRSLDTDVLWLPEYNEAIGPNFRIWSNESLIGFVNFLADGKDFDEDDLVPDGKWVASQQSKFERLLRDKDVSVGISVSNTGVRLTYAPRQETSGYLTFPFSVLRTYDGRIALSAFYKLLNAWSLFHAPEKSRLKFVLEESRKYQNTVSVELSSQVLSALYELVRGFDHAHRLSGKALLKDVIDSDPNQIYKGLLTVLLRIVFLLYAEDRDILFNSKGEKRRQAAATFRLYYSVNALFEQLRADSAIYLDTMDHRYGAWARLVSLFRTIYEGLDFEEFSLLGRKGHLFAPDRFPFLEGRTSTQIEIKPPLITDGTVFRVLSYLMTLDGERISYKALDVEQIGSVYETAMGFKLELASGPSIAIKPKKPHGAPVVINLETLLNLNGKDRVKWLKENADQEEKSDVFKNADSIESLVSALERKIARQATPSVAPIGSLILQPSPERRKTGSHYTPRSLTEPIVRKAFEPIFARLGQNPAPEQILELKVCDPAMGSGAFLVESCRQLAEALVKAWAFHKTKLDIPPDETELIFARRQVARHCIYGVDKNPMAVDLAKLSLWLATFATDHQFTFLDDKLKCGDSLVGLSLNQLTNATWETDVQQGGLFATPVQSAIEEYQAVREEIALAAEDQDYDWLVQLNQEAEALALRIKNVGDMVVSAFFGGTTQTSRRQKLQLVSEDIPRILSSEHAATERFGLVLNPLHWPVEFPEVFLRENSGFDIFVGNPPFLGGKKVSSHFGDRYLDWLDATFPNSNLSADIVAYFFRRAFSCVNEEGSIVFICTNTISQGDTRETGLVNLIKTGAKIFYCTKRLRWPGQAAVVVSVVGITRNSSYSNVVLDNKYVSRISAFLVDGEIDDSPRTLHRNSGISNIGSIVMGMGFTFEEGVPDEASSILKMNEVLKASEAERVFVKPYLGGYELNNNLCSLPDRFVIDFGGLSLDEARRVAPNLMNIVEIKVKPYRDKLKKAQYREKWWLHGERQQSLYEKMGALKRALATCRVSPNLNFTFIDTHQIVADSVVVVLSDQYSMFAVLQSTVHETWARAFGSTMKDDLRYSPTDCLETFPLPQNHLSNEILLKCGKNYFEFRRDLMIQNNEGMTKTYNRFHDSGEDSEGIRRLRELHNQMDRAVLDAYGWTDINPVPEFLADYEEEDGTGSYRLKWPDETRDLVLGRLMELNAQYAAEEAAQGGADER